MKILALSPFTNASHQNITDTIRASNADLIVLPGWSRSIPSPIDLQRALQRNSSILAESRDRNGAFIPVLIKSDTIEKLPMQTFARSPTAKDLDELCAVLPSRKIEIGGKSLSLILCGEINGFDVNGHLKRNRKAEVFAAINPTHSPMGRWHVLEKKYKALSRNSFAIHVTNNTLANPATSTTDVRIYKNGRNLKIRAFNEFSAWCKCEIT